MRPQEKITGKCHIDINFQNPYEIPLEGSNKGEPIENAEYIMK